jgi:hypothetical protein
VQRPTAKELLKTPFIRKAKKNPYLIDLIDRYKKWKMMHNGDSGTDSDNSDSYVYALFASSTAQTVKKRFRP